MHGMEACEICVLCKTWEHEISVLHVLVCKWQKAGLDSLNDIQGWALCCCHLNFLMLLSFCARHQDSFYYGLILLQRKWVAHRGWIISLTSVPGELINRLCEQINSALWWFGWLQRMTVVKTYNNVQSDVLSDRLNGGAKCVMKANWRFPFHWYWWDLTGCYQPASARSPWSQLLSRVESAAQERVWFRMYRRSPEFPGLTDRGRS